LMFNLNNNFEPVKLVSGHYYVLHVTFVSNVKQKSVCYWKENKPSNGAFDLLTTWTGIIVNLTSRRFGTFWAALVVPTKLSRIEHFGCSNSDAVGIL
jgi:hypothetical protein